LFYKNFSSPKLNNPIQIEVHGTKELKQISYQVIGSGSIVESKTISVPNMKKTEFSFTATDEMAPSSHVIVYYITSDGEIISDKRKIELESDLKNPIDIQLSANQVKPSADLNITISTKEDSFVGLLGVDQSVLLLKKGNDIEKSKVLEELKEFNKGTGYNEYYYYNNYRDFKDSDILIMTNAVSEYTGRVYWRQLETIGGNYERTDDIIDIRSGGNEYDGDDDHDFRVYAPKSLVVEYIKTPTKIRNEFPETWLFNSFELSQK